MGAGNPDLAARSEPLAEQSPANADPLRHQRRATRTGQHGVSEPYRPRNGRVREVDQPRRPQALQRQLPVHVDVAQAQLGKPRPGQRQVVCSRATGFYGFVEVALDELDLVLDPGTVEVELSGDARPAQPQVPHAPGDRWRRVEQHAGEDMRTYDPFDRPLGGTGQFPSTVQAAQVELNAGAGSAPTASARMPSTPVAERLRTLG